MTEFRFSVNIFRLGSAQSFARDCRKAEESGYDALYAADHLGVPAPFPVLVAAAHATERLRLGTLVLNAAFVNPVLLAREIATVDVLTGGRLEVGLGAGHMRWEFEAAGIPWERFDERADRLEDTVAELQRAFAEPAYAEQDAAREAFDLPVLGPLQHRGFGGHGPPLIIGGTGDRILTLAATRADVVSIAGVFQIPGRPPGTFRLATAVEADERVAFARARAGARADDVEWHTLLQAVVETEDRAATAAALAARFDHAIDAADLLDSPFVLIGTIDEMARRIVRNRERYGFTHVTVHAPYRDVFAEVVTRVRALGR
ncbi:TIGR03621 family F420-dependent LLM class oxidoreductase [Rhodococcus sp. CH91]|uniref:TIGR03621 family F420-dependent LLM class oxidoreductase n=1 Tax=Rhodococcus sp. CH91 TaxID=2910256 RepID=UPI001F4B9D4A|nr:TIGR03621 family F420-dependent LLM class oxidoreductase [Rhodococcus sp. CH91]